MALFIKLIQSDKALMFIKQDSYPINLKRSLFTFNGQERDDEVAGAGNIMTAEFWEYDTRLGRRWNLDPVDQVDISNYAVNGLNPILFTDPNGDLFGIKGFGSTSEQRNAARQFATEHSGKVNSLLRKSINVTYSKYEQLPIFGRNENQGEISTNFSAGLYLADKKQHFNTDGSIVDDRPQIGVPIQGFWDEINSDYGIAGEIAYKSVDNAYLAFQGSPFGSPFFDKDDRQHVNGEGAYQDEVERGFIDASLSLTLPKGPSDKILTKLNAAKFSQIFRGNLAKLKPMNRGKINNGINFLVEKVNGINWGWKISSKAVEKLEGDKK